MEYIIMFHLKYGLPHVQHQPANMHVYDIMWVQQFDLKNI